jgi:hypothetical protein
LWGDEDDVAAAVEEFEAKRGLDGVAVDARRPVISGNYFCAGKVIDANQAASPGQVSHAQSGASSPTWCSSSGPRRDPRRRLTLADVGLKGMAGRAGTDVAARGPDKHLHYSRGVTVEEMQQRRWRSWSWSHRAHGRPKR